MRGQGVPSALGRRRQQNSAHDEIQRAIDEVRFQAEPAMATCGSAREEPIPRVTPLVVPRFVFVDPINRVDASSIGPIRGQAPLAFLKWFDQLREQLADQQEMLSRCHFEEAD